VGKQFTAIVLLLAQTSDYNFIVINIDWSSVWYALMSKKNFDNSESVPPAVWDLS